MKIIFFLNRFFEESSTNPGLPSSSENTEKSKLANNNNNNNTNGNGNVNNGINKNNKRPPDLDLELISSTQLTVENENNLAVQQNKDIQQPVKKESTAARLTRGLGLR